MSKLGLFQIIPEAKDWKLWSIIKSVQQRMGEGRRCDLFLSYQSQHLRMDGILVTAKGLINQPVAYCPLQTRTLETDSSIMREIAQQLQVAMRIARDPEAAEDLVDAISLCTRGTIDSPMPFWVYGLSCIPLTYEWDQRFLHPRPFCASLFSEMASAPAAIRWLRSQPLQAPN